MTTVLGAALADGRMGPPMNASAFGALLNYTLASSESLRFVCNTTIFTAGSATAREIFAARVTCAISQLSVILFLSTLDLTVMMMYIILDLLVLLSPALVLIGAIGGMWAFAHYYLALSDDDDAAPRNEPHPIAFLLGYWHFLWTSYRRDAARRIMHRP